MPKTRSQGAASPAHELQAAPPRTRARKPKDDNPTEVENAPPVAAGLLISKPNHVFSPIANARIPQNSKASKTKKSVGSTRSTTSRILRSSKRTEELIRDQSPSPELNDPPCCVHCHRNPFDITDAPLVAPKIVFAKPNYKDVSTQCTAAENEESGLTVPPAQTPGVKRTREESAVDVEEQPASKRHQAKSPESTIRTSTSTSSDASTNPSTKVSTRTSMQVDSESTTAGRSPSEPAPTTPKRTTMALFTQSKSRSKSPRFSPITRSQVGSLQITSDMTWGQLNLTNTRRSHLREKQLQAWKDVLAAGEESLQPDQEAAAPTTTETPLQGKKSFFGSLRKAFDFVPQIPASVANMVTNPFSPGRSAPAVEAKQVDSSPAQESINGTEDGGPESLPIASEELVKGTKYSEVKPPRLPLQESSKRRQHRESQALDMPSQQHNKRRQSIERQQLNKLSPQPANSMQNDKSQPPNMPSPQPSDGVQHGQGEPFKMLFQQSMNGSQSSETEPLKMPESTTMSPDAMEDVSYSSPQKVVPGSASTLSNKRKSFGLYYDDPEFVSSDDSDERESLPAPVAKKQKLDHTQTPRSVLKKRTGNGAGTTPRTQKRVTFDESPEGTPSKMRSRAHEYNGMHFADATSPSSDDETNLSNSPGTKANTEANTPFYYEPPQIPDEPGYVLPADFMPTSAHPRPGTFCLDFNTYDENDDDIDWDAPIGDIQSNLVVEATDTPNSAEASTSAVEELAATPTMALPPATPRIAHAELPATTVESAGITIHADVGAGSSSTTTTTETNASSITIHADVSAGSSFTSTTTAETNVLADVTQGQINKVRSTAEQHKSKNPSRLSQVERAATPSPPSEEYNEFDAGWPEPKSYVEAGVCSQRVFDAANAATDEENEFDAGWPEPKSYVEAGVCSQRIFEIVNKNWDPRDTAIGEMVYEQDLEEWTDAHRLEKELAFPVRYPWTGEEEEEEL